MEVLKGSASDLHSPAANTAAVVTYAAIAERSHVVSGIAWSYAGAAPTGGSLKIEDGAGTLIFGPMAITAEGHGWIPFDPMKQGSKNTAMIITLAAGGASATGHVSVLGHFIR